MPQVRIAALSLLLVPVAKTSICLELLWYRFDRWLFIVDFSRLKSRKLPDTDGTADAAETSSS
ncbi:hypothetical protein T03_14923 [Trichinella britovi]|uniref:Uncharacterized protein n=1 Tax=Trichinella britovi TaxID=45882 RepID=A0A0V1AL54_TRIBR|nr:hypothetical protein T03_14923 [Trichinella britovi]